MTPPIRGKTWHRPRLTEGVGHEGRGTKIWNHWDRDFEARCEAKRLAMAKAGRSTVWGD